MFCDVFRIFQVLPKRRLITHLGLKVAYVFIFAFWKIDMVLTSPTLKQACYWHMWAISRFSLEIEPRLEDVPRSSKRSMFLAFFRRAGKVC